MSPDRPQFGIIPPKEAQLRRRLEQKKHPELKSPPSPNDYLKVLPVIEKAIIYSNKEDALFWAVNKKKKAAFAEAVWGTSEIKSYVSPSVACNCLRWVGEEAVYDLTGWSKAESTVDGMLVLKMGSSIHWAIEKILKSYLPGSQEMTLTNEEANISGRMDILMKNPKTGNYQLIELKSIADFAFQQINREKLPDYLRSMDNIYSPKPEHRKQVLLYLWILDKQFAGQGKEIESASIIYIDRDGGKRKEALIPWDSIAKYDAQQFVEQIIEAQKKIEATLVYIRENPKPNKQIIEDMLPEPTVESEYICKTFCPFRQSCLPARGIVADGVKKEQKRRPKGVKRMAEQEMLERQEKMNKLGLSQQSLGIFGK